MTTPELLELSREEMGKVWGGVVGQRFYDWLRGEDVELRETVHSSLGHQHVLEPELRNASGAWAVCKKLLVKAAVRLRKEGSYTRRVALQISFMGDLYFQKDIRVEETQDTLTLLAALRELWKLLPRATPVSRRRDLF